MSGLQIGPVTENRMVKVIMDLGGGVMRGLADDARFTPKRRGLIAPMIGRFMAGEREFAKRR